MLLENDGMMPAQWFAGRREVTPERELLVAVFHDAINCILDTRITDRRRYDALEWFNSDLEDFPGRFTFLYMCGELGYNPAQWRTFANEQAAKRTVGNSSRKVVMKIKRHSPRGLRVRQIE